MFNLKGLTTAALSLVLSVLLIVAITCGRACAQAPGAPTNLVAVTISSSQINLTWTAPSATVTGYNIYRSATSGGPYTLDGSSSVPSYSSTGLDGGTSYYYVISALNGSSEGPESSELGWTTLCDAPTGLTATPGTGQITLSWLEPQGTAYYSVYRSTTSGAETPLAGAQGVYGTNYVDIAVQAGVTYYYTVTATGGAGESLQSSEVEATATSNGVVLSGVSLSPSSLIGQHYSTGTVTLAGPVPAGYDAYVSLSSSNTSAATLPSTVVVPAGESSATFSLQTYTVSAATDVTVTASYAGVSETAVLTVNPFNADAPSAPADVTATTISDGQIDLTWTAPSGTVTGYNIYQSLTSGGPYSIISTSTMPSYSNTGLDGGTVYYYVVTALNGSSEGPQSSEIGCTTLCDPPSGLTATASTGEVSLSWSAESQAAFCSVYRGTSSGSETLLSGAEAVYATNYIDFSVEPGMTYYYTVTETGGAGESLPSNEVEVTVPSVSAPPSGVTITVNTAQPIMGRTASVTGSATDAGTVTYSWSISPSASISPSTGANTTITFPSAGNYLLTLTVTDSYGQHASASQSISVFQAVTGVSVTPSTVSVSTGGEQQFTASENDQFGNALSVQPTWNWSGTNGSVTSTGIYNAPLATGTATVTALDPNSGLSGSASVTIGNYPAPPFGAAIIVNTAQPITGTSASLTGSATDPNSGLTYSWSSSPNASFSSTTGANTTVTFPSAGTYAITLTAADTYGQIATT